MTAADTTQRVSFPNLDGLRFFCFLAVFLYHSFHTSSETLRQTDAWRFARRLVANGNLGVNCFFVLSGFLITYLLLEEKGRTGTVHVGHFYVRRILRIWPLYYACVLFGFVVFPWLKRSANLVPTDTANVPAYLFFLSNFDLLQNGLPDASSLGVLWSIAVEEQFYLSWPLLLALTAERQLGLLFAVITALSLAFRGHHLANTQVLDLHTLAVISDMGIGGLAAYLAKTSGRFVAWTERLSGASIVTVYAGLGAILLFRDALFSTHPLRLLERVMSGSVFALIILEQNYARRSLFKFSSSPMLTRLGQYTYGMYCLHMIAILSVLQITSLLGLDRRLWQILLLQPVLSLLLTIVGSYVSYAYFEAPFLRLKRRFQFVSRG